MTLKRSLAVLVLAAGLSGGALAQKPVLLDDESIFAAVEEVLHGAPALAAARITVRSQDGFVTLSGSADTQKDIAAAVGLASGVRGVTGVKNEIRVGDRPSRA